MSKPKPCRHLSSCWILAGGHLLWCYACGALRKMEPSSGNITIPVGPWTKPTGDKADNPWDRFARRSK